MASAVAWASALTCECVVTDNVLQLAIPPKRIVEIYRDHTVIIEYDPPSRMFKHTITWTSHFAHYSHPTETVDKARKAAHKFIDVRCDSIPVNE